MSTSSARAVADPAEGIILARVDIKATPERVYRALTTEEVARWWGSAELYQTTRFTMDLRPGGRWRSEGVGSDGSPFVVQGEVVETDPPWTLVQTWQPDWDPGPPTTIHFRLEATDTGTRLTLRHTGFVGRPESCQGHAEGWERVLTWLDGHFVPAAPALRTWLCRLIPPRPTFVLDMDDAERAIMRTHAGYWNEHLATGVALAFGPVADPKGGWGLGILRAEDEAAVRAFEAKDPAVESGRGFYYEVLPMPMGVFV
jgi:uncharacterized protein YndB with AHSA1/START domain